MFDMKEISLNKSIIPNRSILQERQSIKKFSLLPPLMNDTLFKAKVSPKVKSDNKNINLPETTNQLISQLQQLIARNYNATSLRQ